MRARAIAGLLVPAAATLGLMLPGTAAAGPVVCATTVSDGQGATWTTNAAGAVTASVTSGAVTRPNAYDTFGTAFVGGASYSAGATACDATVDPVRGTAIRYPAKTVSGLQVERVLTFRALPVGGTSRFVHAMISTLIVKNTTASAVAGTTVAVGEDSSPNVDDLGSDGATRIVSTGNGNSVVDLTDAFAITADGAAATVTDPVILHGWTSAVSAAVRDVPDVVGPAGATGTADADNWRTRWSGVSLPAGATKTYTTVEVLALPADGTLATALFDLQSARFASISADVAFSATAPALTAAEIAASENFDPPVPSLGASVPDRAAVGEPVQLILRPSTPSVPQCAPSGTSLALGGSERLAAPGRLLLENLAPGSYPWSASVQSPCGDRTTGGTVVVAPGITSCSHDLDYDGVPLFDATGAAYGLQSYGTLSGGFLGASGGQDQPYDAYGFVELGDDSGPSPVVAGGCAWEADGRLQRVPERAFTNAIVTRSLWVPADGQGARLVTTLRNPSAQAVTVPFRIGSGDPLESGNQTVVVATGDGGGAPSPTARWMVTDDADGADTPSLVHVWDGAGGRDRADAVKLVTGAVPGTGMLEVDYADVTLAPGESATYVFWAAQRRRQPRAAGERADAIAAATVLAGLSGSALYGAMSAAEIASVRNWARPVPTGSLSGPASGPTGAPQTFTVTGLSGGADTPQCGAGSVAWKVDGAPVAGGASISPSFATAGVHTVTATISGDCGADPVVRSASFTATGATKVVEQKPKPAAAKLSALKVTGGCVKAPKAKATLKVSLKASGASKVKLKLVRLKGAAVKTCVVASSAAGKKLLKRLTLKSVLTKTASVKAGKASFTVPIKVVRSGVVVTKAGRTTLPRGVYRLTVSLTTNKKPVSTLVIIR